MKIAFNNNMGFCKLYLWLIGKGSLYYVSGPQILPAPLKSDEENDLIDRIAQGDNTAREPLIVHNLRLVVYIAQKFDNTGVSQEDLVSIGTIGLIKAVNTFCPDKNIKLATYASRCISNEILMYLRKNGNLRNEISLDEPLNTDWDGNELHFSDVLTDPVQNLGSDLENEDDIHLLMQCVEKLPAREKEIITLRFGLFGNKEYTQKEVADLMGISQSYISRLEKKILKRLKKEIEKEDI
ncbi:MAG: RNA polymerase sporulation sigma factor SigE [Clostridia bacterium]|nr:RNA polymerase sporulation sigma factor SigE [Clostridia bacterium]MBR2414118.1 RNA polymerase sporulation sigma factor SigE [Clostridia bacterium]MBR3955225.1 RNA polymerase sporulation sigma factor SigE [Clostridia bacterium]